MLSRKEEKFIRSLQQRKFRQQNRVFLAEGEKLVKDLLSSGMKTSMLVSLTEYKDVYSSLADKHYCAYRSADIDTLHKISGLSTPSQIIGIFKFRDEIPSDKSLPSGLILYLDGIRDPGNMGTILRIADWFGISLVIGSEDTVELYNPKVVQSSMGSLGRTDFRIMNADTLKQMAGPRPIIGSTMRGANMYSISLPGDAILVIGNEANGIRSEMSDHIDQWVSIPSFSKPGQEGQAESLNAAVATALLCAEFKRNAPSE